MDKIYYAVYKVTNRIDGKFYIGAHKTKDLNDDYMGSGKYLKHAQCKYGIENFVKEILFVFDTSEEMFAKEADIVNEDFLATENTYNLKIGGHSSWEYANRTKTNVYGENGKSGYGLENLTNHKGSRSLTEVLQERGTFETWTKKLSNVWKSKFDAGYVNHFQGKTHTLDSKSKIGQANSINQQGVKNSQFGSMWITNGAENQKIRKDSPIPDGWRSGRIIRK